MDEEAAKKVFSHVEKQKKASAVVGQAYKKLYLGAFNYNRQIIEEYTRAHNEREAWTRMTARIAVAKGATTYTIRQYFNGAKDNFKIEEVKE